jgi:hypothetical protein
MKSKKSVLVSLLLFLILSALGCGFTSQGDAGGNGAGGGAEPFMLSSPK